MIAIVFKDEESYFIKNIKNINQISMIMNLFGDKKNLSITTIVGNKLKKMLPFFIQRRRICEY